MTTLEIVGDNHGDGGWMIGGNPEQLIKTHLIFGSCYNMNLIILDVTE